MDDIAASWANFFIAEVGATASLTGLIIVAVSINLKSILENPQLPGRAGEMLIMLVCVLLTSSLGLMPGQATRTFGAEVAVAGLLMTVSPLTIQLRHLRAIKEQPISWWLWRFIVVLCAGVPVMIGGGELVAGRSEGFYWAAAGILATLAATILNSWVLLVEILR